MEKGQIVYKAKEVICLHCGEKQSLTSANYAEWLDECVLFREEHKSCRKQELGKMTDTQQKLDKLAEHVANLEAEVALLNNAVSAQPTLRDQFAIAALPECASEHRYKNDNGETVAREAYMFADAMLKERKK